MCYSNNLKWNKCKKGGFLGKLLGTLGVNLLGKCFVKEILSEQVKGQQVQKDKEQLEQFKEWQQLVEDKDRLFNATLSFN